AAAAILLISILVYSNSINNGFVWDDRGTIVSNTSITSIKNIPSFFTTDQWKITGNPSSSYYRPLANTFWTLEFQLWGNGPLGYHITSIILHAFLSLILYLLCFNITGSSTSAFFASLIFSVHPVHTENVAWTTGVSSIVCAILITASLLLYMRFSEKRSKVSLTISLICFLFAVFSYEYALMLPFILIAYEFLIVRRKIRIKILMPYLLIVLFYLAARKMVISAGITYDTPLFSRILTSFVIHAKYLQSFFLPFPVKVLYDIQPPPSIFNIQVITSIFVLTAVWILMFLLYNKDKKALFAVLWFFVFLLPVANIIVIVKPQMMSLRYLYIPSMGLSILSGIYLEKISSKLKMVPFIIILVLSVITLNQNKYWQDDITLYRKMVVDSPSSSLARNNLGVAYLEANRLPDALKEFQIAAESNPKNRFALFNLGDTYRALNRTDEAVFYLRKALEIDPKDSRAYNSLGLTYKNMGKPQEAIDSFTLALNANPFNAEAHYNLANLLFKMGKEDDSIIHYERFVELATEKYKGMKIQVIKMLKDRGVNAND
ncbi:MAG: hypothetical protein A2X59_02540, partial [Nitrospirae bacterium GWC2_42_7]